ncbi:MAG: ATP-binding cassette domain-containing protein [Methylacidiphilales bacterium]|nr:ATP-binding cassette domain-containing protein [Candidatus Methylacidiphilales bacterium]
MDALTFNGRLGDPGILEDEHIVVEGVSKRYPAASEPALIDVSLSVRRGKIFGVIGRSGAGKSTLIRTLNRLEQPTTGQVLIDGEDIATFDSARLIGLRRRVGMIFQHFNLLSAKTVWQNVALPLKVARIERPEIERRVGDLLEMVGLAEKRDVYPARLSGGQKQRVGIARALVHRPEVLLCDEATSALDPESTQAILGLLQDINRRLGLSIVLITHEMQVIREVCHRVVVLEKGCVVEQGDVWKVFGDPQHEVTQTLLGTVQRSIPPDLLERLAPHPTHPADSLLLDLHFTGSEGRAPDIGLIAQAFGTRTQLLYGGIDRIQGRPQGHLIVSIDAFDSRDEVLRRAHLLADKVRELGFVAAGH